MGLFNSSIIDNALNKAKSLGVAEVNKQLTSITGNMSGVAGLTSLFGGALGSNSANTLSASASAAGKEFRIRLSPQPSGINTVYGPESKDTNVLTILRSTNGLVFPYTPTINWSQAVEYTAMSFVHSNQDHYAYKNTPSTQLSITGDFTVQNQREGEYMIAVIHFLRTVSKMYFGKAANDKAGLPPPILILSGYGNFMFNDLPVIVKDHSYTLPNNVDYVDIQVAGGYARLPSILTVQMTLIVQNTPKALRTEFDLDKFRTGELMRGNNKGWI